MIKSIEIENGKIIEFPEEMSQLERAMTIPSHECTERLISLMDKARGIPLPVVGAPVFVKLLALPELDRKVKEGLLVRDEAGRYRTLTGLEKCIGNSKIDCKILQKYIRKLNGSEYSARSFERALYGS